MSNEPAGNTRSGRRRWMRGAGWTQSSWTTRRPSLSKLKGYGISGMLLEWIRNFLMNRKMRVVINGEETNWAPVLSGVPQGSVLGPLLFLIYVNELPDIIESSVRMFADDTKLWRKIQNEEDEQILQQDLD